MISILGGGSWGLALAFVLNNNNVPVKVWARDEKQVDLFNREHISKYFDPFVFPSSIKMTSSIDEALSNSDTLVLSVPVKATVGLAESIKDKIHDKNVVLTAKGLDNGEILSERLKPYISSLKLAVLSGPSFASEVIQKKTTCVVIASENSDLSKELQNDFSSDFFRVYTSDDVIGVELCGALKNVYAIGSGFLDGKKVGYNTKASYLTRSLHELGNIVLNRGGKETTLLGLSGIGDLILTCTSPTSRNYSFGYNFNGDTTTAHTVEGLYTLPNILEMADKYKIDMPIVKAINSIIFNNEPVEEVIKRLMGRSKKSEEFHKN
ncbi:glycerol-3-phosphate dehydrogenase [NAD(P)+] [Clostridium sp. CAG:568]|nr:glycerol-3-phosphate dehydrogenase [NAD(P)+] [Clostridium sp. CAG:568]